MRVAGVGQALEPPKTFHGRALGRGVVGAVRAVGAVSGARASLPDLPEPAPGPFAGKVPDQPHPASRPF